MKRKLVSLMLVAAMTAGVVAGCGSNSDSGSNSNDSSESGDSDDGSGKVYYLNFKPEQDEAWQDLAKAYTDETGVEVTVLTAADGTYESTLKSEMAKDVKPTLFQVNGPVGLATWKDYCADLSGSDVYSHLTSEDYALKDGSSVLGVAYVIETYGIIYNKTILNDYISMDNAVVSSIDEINNFDTLKAVADDIQSRLSEINDQFGYNLKGAFTSAGMDSSSDWRFKTHLANLPIYYEYKADGIGSTDAIKGTYLDNYKKVWDLYITDATCEPGLLSSKTGDEAESEFGMQQAVFYQNGTWEYGNLTNDENGYEVTADDFSMMPIYIGVDGEENQGLCTGSENYWCVNSQASEDDQQATLDFLNWVITSDTGRDSLANVMGFTTPFDSFADGYVADNCLIKADQSYTAAGKTPVTWCFTTMPSENWKDGVGSALLEYAQGTGDWDGVVSAFVDGWATEYAAAN
ncbi:MAG: ABC transporter substrate-binding protein [Lachnospiraceae bacterium]|nr:ABC transporter substrate-binding protein [Lachnospiraceae bacterium]